MQVPDYPPPLTIQPLKSHKQTIILLHGRGDNGPSFGHQILSALFPLATPPNSPVLHSSSPKTLNLRATFPYAKFIFPTAPKRRPVQYNLDLITQWFDLWWSPPSSSPADDNNDRPFPLARDSLQSSGLRESTEFLHDLLRREIALVEGGAKNVLLGGLSQGCATSLVACLLWGSVGGWGGEGGGEVGGEALGALVGFCGRLPFERRVRDILAGGSVEVGRKIEGGESNPFSGTDGEGEEKSQIGNGMVGNVINFLREELGIIRPPGLAPLSQDFPFQRTPLFLGHGVKDMTVPIRLGRETVTCLEALGMTVSWNEYEDLGHWYSESMLSDFVKFVREKTDWEVE